ncbi:MarR family winged helix-turn-helix transcriptional regulator [Lysinibacter cavernae]|uniref:DNA-binding MarR family transcriptional regulator n=1 Tax=Lysinibacter cavernae TaxID=1640652 RepID=A0A7X5TSF9_9MICO|nr:MarR family transcriptional regulator [Lysinibacter cavernae]NIH53466.1 DNA-binding MarR family transcriptional regulator [Lysinibacter cavernae]
MTPPLNTDFPDADDSTGFVLWRVTNAWQAAQRAALKPFGLTHVQFVLLATLTWTEGEGPITQRNLASAAGTDTMMTSQVVRTLEAAGHVMRRPHPTDRRAVALSPTPQGLALVNRAIVAVEACDAAFFEPLGGSRDHFTRMLVTLQRA